MADERIDLYERLTAAILTTPGDTDMALRQALAQLTNPDPAVGVARQAIPPELVPFATRVATHAYTITDQDTAGLLDAGYSEDAIFEIVLSVALGTGTLCLQQGLAAIKEAQDAITENRTDITG